MIVLSKLDFVKGEENLESVAVMDCYHNFIDDKRTYCSQKTVAYYQDNLTRLFNCLREYYAVELEKITADMITMDFLQNYIMYLRSCDISNVSVKTYYRAVKVFSTWLYRRKIIEGDVAMDVKTPKAYPEEKIPLTVQEVEFIDSYFDINTEKGIRNYLIFHLMLDCGLRRGEVVALTKQDIDFENHIISVIGKGSKNRFVPVPDALLSLFTTYHSLYDLDPEAAFVTLRDNQPISENTVKLMFRDLKAECGLERLHPHLLRHTFATSYILGGGNVEFLRILLGHADIQTTQMYMHISSNCRLLNMDVYRLDEIFFKIFRYY